MREPCGKIVNKQRFNISLYFFIAIFIVVGFFSIFGLDKKVEAATVELYGYGWSDTLGWVSFNSCITADPETCGPQDYAVTVNDSNGRMSGQAWSENVGWIAFGNPLGNYPAGLGGDATITLNGANKGRIRGWARVCSGTLPGDCSSMTSRTDGWDGWMHLSDNSFHLSPDFTGNGGVTYNEATQKLIGNAWWGEVGGWFNFYDVSFGPPSSGTFDYALTNTSPNYEKEIEQGNTGNVSVKRVFLSGTTQESVELSVVSSYSSEITLDFATNLSCDISPVIPDCSSQITIVVNPTAPTGDYEFIVGGISDPSDLERTTTIKFKVVPQVPNPNVTCEAQDTLFYPGDTVIWQAEVENAVGDESFTWVGEKMDGCSVRDVCPVEYSTVGPKSPSVSIDDGSSFATCKTVNVIPNIFQLFEI